MTEIDTNWNPAQRVLMGPGPSAVHPRVLQAMARQQADLGIFEASVGAALPWPTRPYRDDRLALLVPRDTWRWLLGDGDARGIALVFLFQALLAFGEGGSGGHACLLLCCSSFSREGLLNRGGSGSSPSQAPWR